MADQRITIGIGTTYTGEGMTKALGTMKQLSGAVTRSAGIVSAMAGTMGDLDASTAKCMNAVAGMMQALASGNPVVIGMTAAMIALSKITGEYKKQIEELKESSARLKASVDAAFDKALTKSLTSAQKEAAALVAQFDRITKAANEMTAAVRGVEEAQGNGSLLDQQMRKLEAVIAAQQSGNEELVAAQWDLAIALEAGTQAQEKATRNLDAVNASIEQSAEREKKLTEAKERAATERAALEDTLWSLEGDKRKKVIAAIDKLRGEEEKYAEQIAAERQKRDVLAVNRERAEVELANVQKKNALENEKAAANIRKIDLAATQQKLNDATTKLADAHKAVADAEKNYQAALEKYNANINANLANDRLNDYYAKVAAAGGTGHVIKGWTGAGKGEDQRAAEVVAQQGIRDGSIRNTRQLADTRKAAARANRDYNSSKEAAQERKDAEDYARLSGMSEKSMNAWQKKRLADLQALKDTKDKDAAELAAAEEAKQQAQRAEAQMQMDVADIKNLLEQKLGLK